LGRTPMNQRARHPLHKWLRKGAFASNTWTSEASRQKLSGENKAEVVKVQMGKSTWN